VKTDPINSITVVQEVDDAHDATGGLYKKLLLDEQKTCSWRESKALLKLAPSTTTSTEDATVSH
jgi:hypothetical protein